MSDEAKVQPALTAEEWAAQDRRIGFHFGVHRLGGAVHLFVEDESYAYNNGTECSAADLHALAALALHGQEFGFTRRDVANELMTAARLEAEAECCRGTVLDDDKVSPLFARAVRHRSLAARIEALLPPAP